MSSEKQNNPQDSPKIKVCKNGPYLINGEVPIVENVIATDSEGTPIQWQPGTQYPQKKTCTLCRCGQTKTTPFCDGSHAKTRFDGTETAGNEEYLNKPVIVEGPALKLVDIVELCASARFCHKEGGIWKLVPRSDNPHANQTACEEASNCPSGRLTVVDKKTGQTSEPDLPKSIVLIEDKPMGVKGPIWVRGCIPVESAEGKTYAVRNRVTLCRCGKSQNKPFCDSSHYPE